MRDRNVGGHQRLKVLIEVCRVPMRDRNPQRTASQKPNPAPFVEYL